MARACQRLKAEAVIPQNGDEAKVQGVELSYQQALRFGVILGFNYTYTDAEGKLDGERISLLQASKNTYNASLGYEKGPLSFRLTAAYISEAAGACCSTKNIRGRRRPVSAIRSEQA
jgi:outer membrane receptor protein involved in Fe transport